MLEKFKNNIPREPKLPKNDKAESDDAMILREDPHPVKEKPPLNLNEAIDAVYWEMAELSARPSAEEIEAAIRRFVYERHAGRHSAVLTDLDFIQAVKKIEARLRRDKEKQGVNINNHKQKLPGKELKINPHRLGEVVNWVTDQIIEDENLKAPPTLGEIKAQIQELVRQEGSDAITAADINFMAGKVATELWRKKGWQVDRGK